MGPCSDLKLDHAGKESAPDHTQPLVLDMKSNHTQMDVATSRFLSLTDVVEGPRADEVGLRVKFEL